MPVSPSRSAAFDILLQVEREDAYASELLHADRYQHLSPADHGLTTEIVMGVLRWQSSLDSELSRVSSQKLARLDREVLISLRMAAFQLTRLDRVPAHAAVHESVELVKRARKRSAAPFVNALLRKLSSTQGSSPAPDVLSELDQTRAGDFNHMADQFAHPVWLVERWLKTYGPEKLPEILRADQQIPVTAIRLPSPSDRDVLEKGGVVLLNGSLLKDAARIDSGHLTTTEPFRAGRIVIQDEASQLVALLVGKGTHILDCCAAPGGKTRLISDHNPGASILATELHPHRARLLRRLVPAENVAIVAADIRQFPLRGLFDRVLADVPCSGTGTLRHNPEIKWRLKPTDLIELQSKQLAILESAMKYVVPNGRLIYSTCSLEPEENQDVIEKALSADPSFQICDCRSELERLRQEGELVWSDLDSLLDGRFLRTIPGVHPCDGFFAAILEKK